LDIPLRKFLDRDNKKAMWSADIAMGVDVCEAIQNGATIAQ
jgi:hypothetical protein